jgi:hypothetical protein
MSKLQQPQRAFRDRRCPWRPAIGTDVHKTESCSDGRARNRTGYRSSEAELSAIRKLNPFGTCD